MKTKRKYELLNNLGEEVLVILTTQYVVALSTNQQEEFLSKPTLVTTEERSGVRQAEDADYNLSIL